VSTRQKPVLTSILAFESSFRPRSIPPCPSVLETASESQSLVLESAAIRLRRHENSLALHPNNTA
jgi:hypothetical protein